MKKTKRLVLLAMLTAVAMILSYVESLLPQVGIPGVKMGLANIAVIFALFRFGWKEAAALSLVRVLLVSLLFGSVGAMLYSLAGAVLSLAVMALLRRTDRFSTVGVSVAGGVAHNAGQILNHNLYFTQFRPVTRHPSPINSSATVSSSSSVLARPITRKALK